jgi:hypothetical protein
VPKFLIPTPFDRRTWCKYPIAAVFDRQLRVSDYRALGAICIGLDRVGTTFISHAGMAKKLGISRQLANRYYLRLMRLGYIERVKRRGRGYITRVIFERTF